MKWTVLFTPRAERELTAVWLAAADRHAMTSAANKLDQRLAADPESIGQVRFDTVSIVEIIPLGLEFEIIPDDRLVMVLAVWDSTKSAPP